MWSFVKRLGSIHCPANTAVTGSTKLTGIQFLFARDAVWRAGREQRYNQRGVSMCSCKAMQLQSHAQPLWMGTLSYRVGNP